MVEFTPHDILTAFYNHGASVVSMVWLPVDRTYHPVEREFYQGPCGAFYRQELTRWGLLAWRKRHDCDNKARFMAECIQGCYAANFIDNDDLDMANYPEGAAGGEVMYVDDKVGPHAINWILDAKSKLWYGEPQTQTIITLSDTERKSIFAVRA